MIDPALILPLAWGLIVLISFVGWGSLVRRIFYGPAVERQWGPAAATGVCAVIAVTGLLNLFHIASAAWLTGVVVIGACVACVWGLPRRGQRMAGSDRLAWIVCFVVVAFAYAGTARRLISNPDDCTGYFPLARELLQTGTINDQPFSERRMLSLGGDTALRAMVIMKSSYEFSPLLDPGIALIILAGVMAAIARRWGTYGVVAAAIPIFVVISPEPAVNATSTVMLIALFCALVLAFSDAAETPQIRGGYWAEAGLLAAGAAALKSSAVPVVVVFSVAVVAWLFLRDWHKRPGRRAIAIFCGAALGVLLPWMIGMKISSGTLLFPVLGDGFHHGSYARFNLHSIHLSMLAAGIDSYMRLALLAIIGWLILRGWRFGPAAKVVLLFCVASVVAAKLLAIRMGDYMLYRFQYPFLFAGFAVVAALLGGRRLSRTASRMAAAGFMTLLALTAVAVQIYQPAVTLIADWQGLRKDPHLTGIVDEEDTVVVPGLAQLYQRAQATIPPGRTILLVCAHGYLMDFSRNRCLIADNVGTCSPPPGMPLDDANGLAAYLRARGVRYILDTPVYTTYVRKVSGDPKSYPATDVDYVWRISRFQGLFVQIREHFPIIFDRGGITVVDLGDGGR